MKNKLFVLILLLGILIVPTKEVFAEGEEVNNKISWEKTTDWNYPATIEIKGIDLYVYEEIEGENQSLVSENNDKYLKYIPDKKISLDLNKFKLNLDSKNKTLSKIPATYVDLGLDITKADLEELLSSEMAAASKEKAYLIEMMVNYEVKNYPEQYSHMYAVNLYRDLINAFSGKVSEKVDLSLDQKQVFNIAVITFSEEENKAVLNYETTATQENGLGGWILNYLLFTKKEISTESAATEDSYAIMFHNIDNIDFIIENLEKIADETEEEVKESSNIEQTREEDQIVAVPDTAKNATIFIGIVGIISLISGLVIISQIFIKKGPIGV